MGRHLLPHMHWLLEKIKGTYLDIVEGLAAEFRVPVRVVRGILLRD